MSKTMKRCFLAGMIAAAGCSSMPTGPSLLVLPGTGRSYEQFRGDDAVCRQNALLLVGGVTPGQAAAKSGMASAAIGSAVGAAAGAAIGGGSGAAIGAGTGLAAGSLAGAGAADSTGTNAQKRYDNAYIQCMYAMGHRVPVWGNFTESNTGTSQQECFPPPPPNQPPPKATDPRPL